MKLFWPCAKHLMEDGRIESLCTYDSCLDLAHARKVIADWRDWYKYDIRKAWIDVYESGKKIEVIHINPKTDEIIIKGGNRNVPQI